MATRFGKEDMGGLGMMPEGVSSCRTEKKEGEGEKPKVCRGRGRKERK